RGHLCKLSARPGVNRLDLPGVSGRAPPVIRGAGRIEARESLADVAHVNDAVARIEPGVLIDGCGKLPAGNRMLLLCGPGPRAAADHDLRAVEACLFEQGFE